LARARPRAVRLLNALDVRPWHEPEDGMFLWCRLPAGIDGARLAQAGLQQGLMLAPGNVFSQSQSAGGMMRFNVSQMDDPRLPDRLATLLKS
ncbi:MAG: PLP-dependent aminotransferase family protein, partial [Castellaniella sp.]